MTSPRRAAVAAALLLAATAALAAPARAAQTPRQDSGRPNVLLILADDLGFSDLGCYGGEIPTPNLDRLARGGARFSAFTNSARCCPSRASLLTGLHPHQTGVGAFATRRPKEGGGEAYAGHLLEDCATLAELLGDAGYSTWMVGKWHLGTPGPIARGFHNYWGFANPLAYSADQWDPGEYARLPEGTEPELDLGGDFYATDAFTDYALEFLRQARDDAQRPWFLYVAHSSPHFPVQAPKESIDRHVETYRRGWDALRAERFARMQELGLVPEDAALPPRSLVPVDEEAIANGYPGERNPAWDSLPAARREDLARRMATYAAMVEHVDRGVGRILADLEQHGELENTLILFLSDNGACYEWGPFGFDGPSRRGVTTLHEGEDLERIGQAGTWHSYGSGWANLCNTPLNLYKHFCHEGGIASPLIVHWPERVAPRDAWVRDPAHLMDVVPTVLQATGAEYPQARAGHALQPVEGVSLLEAAAGGEALPGRALAYEHMGARGLRRGRWKITWGKRMPWEPRWALYDLATDRSEQHDLSAEHPGRKAALVAEWEDWARRVGAEPFHGQEPGGGDEAGSDDADSDEADAPGAGDDAPELQTPWVEDRILTIRCRFDAGDGAAGGVLLAQGGRSHGWALHLMDGRPAFDVRRNTQVTRVAAETAVRGEVTLTAVLDEDTMTIRRGERVLASRPSPGLLVAQPLDPLDVGEDGDTAAGDYEPPNRYSGRILEASVEPAGKPPEPPPEDYGAADPDPAPPAGFAPLFDHWMRDTYVTRGPDGAYYLTGTTAAPGRDFGGGRPHCWDWNDGIRLWRSEDLEHWEPLGLVWSLDEDATWQAGFAEGEPFTAPTGERLPGRKRAVWAPELHYLRSAGNWFLVACMNDSAGGPGSFVLRSTSGRPEGPYENVAGNADGPLFPRIDGSLFEDEDGSVWFIGHNHHYAPMKADVSGLAGPVRRFDETPYDPEPYLEGAFVFRHAGRYHLAQAAWSFRMPDGSFSYARDARQRGGERWSYDLVIASADELGGPYGPRHTAGVGIGHDNLFRAADGRVFATAFGNPRTDRPQPFTCRPAIVEMAWDGERLRVAQDPQPRRTAAEKRARPNVIVILADDQGWGTTSIAYDPRVPASRSDFFRTPALERLAASGRRFTQGYAAHPNCSPSRAALLTGRSPAALHFTDVCGRQSGAYYEGNRLIPPRHVDALNHDERTIPELLKAAHPPYRAAHFGKWHLRGGGPEEHGFDGGDGETGNREGTLPTNLPDDPKQIFGITERGIAWMEEQVVADRPFYLQLSHYATHLGYQSRPATRARFEDAGPGARHDNVRYAAMLADLDVGVGRVLDAVERLGIGEHTYVIYTADNGTYPTDDPANVNGPVRGTKATLWEGGVRVPFIVSGPGIAPDTVSREPAIGWDLLPTVCALAGVPEEAVPAAVEGGDLSPALFADDAVERRRDALSFHWPHYQHQKNSVPTTTILRDGLKLHWFWEDGHVELYDLDADLDESEDLAAERPAAAAQLRDRLFRWLDSVEAQRPRPNPDYDPATDPARR